MKLSYDNFQSILDSLLSKMNCMMACAKKAFLIEDVVESIKFAVGKTIENTMFITNMSNFSMECTKFLRAVP